ncbi:hypothetical protein HZH66_012049 [Vespula vulgaris]|uniref:Uncharacterized protein n=1 Tax=Vespula vulgaris TaxID=7454 RepID=A0A834MVX8_VESVU|nr:hypothetical protein HZH66_012049 [Vespula vulgaris]
MLEDIYVDTSLASTPLRNSSVTTRSFASLPLGWTMWEDGGIGKSPSSVGIVSRKEESGRREDARDKKTPADAWQCHQIARIFCALEPRGKRMEDGNGREGRGWQGRETA